MLRRIVSTVFYAAVVVIAAWWAIWLTVTGHTLHTGGLLMALGAALAAILFGFRVAEGLGPDRLSIWPGRVPSVPVEDNNQLGKAA